MLIRLDRVLINLSWDALFPNSHLTSLTRFVSDHVPLLVTVSTSVPSSRLFRFERFWTSFPACSNIVRGCWQPGPQRHGGRFIDPAASLAQKIKVQDRP